MKKSIIRRYFFLCILSGIIMGLVFPFFSSIFMTKKSPLYGMIFFVACIIAGIFVGAISFYIGKVTLLKTIGKLNICFDHISKGDFTYQCNIESADAIGQLLINLSSMSSSLEQLIRAVATKSVTIDNIVKDNSTGLSELHNSIKDIHSFTSEVSQDMTRVAHITDVLLSVSLEIKHAINSITDKAQEGVNASNIISDRAESAKSDVMRSLNAAELILSETSKRMEVAIKDTLVVDEINILLESIMQITSQTNLLAINASIEASRTGENGNGFAVIASEIRALSAKSKQNASKISTITSGVITSVRELVSCSQELLHFLTVNVSQDFHKLLGVVGEYSQDTRFIDDMIIDFSSTSQQLFSSVQVVFDDVTEIAASAKNSSEKTNKIFLEIESLTNKSANLLNETELLNNSSAYLKDAIAKFNLD